MKHTQKATRYENKPKFSRLTKFRESPTEGLLNTDGEALLNTDGETLFNTGS